MLRYMLCWKTLINILMFINIVVINHSFLSKLIREIYILVFCEKTSVMRDYSLKDQGTIWNAQFGKMQNKWPAHWIIALALLEIFLRWIINQLPKKKTTLSPMIFNGKQVVDLVMFIFYIDTQFHIPACSDFWAQSQE